MCSAQARRTLYEKLSMSTKSPRVLTVGSILGPTHLVKLTP